MNTDDTNGAAPKVPQAITFEEYLKNLTTNIHNYLNEGSSKKVGFACFIFEADNALKQASVISNCKTESFYPLLRRFTSRLTSKKRKRMDA